MSERFAPKLVTNAVRDPEDMRKTATDDVREAPSFYKNSFLRRQRDSDWLFPLHLQLYGVPMPFQFLRSGHRRFGVNTDEQLATVVQ